MAGDQTPEWMTRDKLSPRHKAPGRPVPPIPARLAGANMKKPVDRVVSEKFEQDFSALIECCVKDDEYDITCRIHDCMDEGKISPPQAHRLLRTLFHKFDGGPGMCRVDQDGNVHELHRWGAA